MKIWTTIILLAAVTATGLYIQLAERHRETTDEKKAAARLALKFDPDRVTDLRIETGSELFILSKSNRTWRLVSPVSANADASAVMRIIDTIAELRKSEIITFDEIRELGSDPRRYGFDRPRATVTLSDGPWERTVLVGRDSPGAYQLYMKRLDREEIIVTDRDILDVLPATILDIRDRHLFTGPPGAVQRIELESGDRTWQASRDEQEQWTIERPVYARAISSAVRQWIDGLYEFRIHDFIADSVAAGSLYGFDDPVAQVSLFDKNSSVPQLLKIGRAADAGESSYYATLAGREAVFTVTSSFVDWLRQDTAAFRDTRLLFLAEAEVRFIELTEGEQSLQLARSTQGVWEVVSPKRFTAHEARVQNLIARWTGARAAEFIDPPFSLGEEALIREAGRQVLIARTRAVRPVEAAATNRMPSVLSDDATYLLAGGAATGAVYAVPADQSYMIRVPEDLLTSFSVNPLDYRDPVVLNLDPYSIRRITQRSGTNEMSAARTNGLFRAVNADLIPDQAAAEAILSLVSRLVVVRLIEEDATDLSPYGLDEPRHTVILGLTGETGINRVVLLGLRAGPNETFAMIQGTDLVFTLSDEAVDILRAPIGSPLTPAATPPVPAAP